ncbi:PKD domain-containing protein [Cytophagaceae bacterium ABcell3]|nr:PKD domain-containing protein [Cytophagaceae bacterium ABcell3]
MLGLRLHAPFVHCKQLYIKFVPFLLLFWVFNSLESHAKTFSTPHHYSAPTLSNCQENPIASFLLENNTSCQAPHTVTFINTTEITPHLNFTWHLGDGTIISTNEKTISHTYTEPGAYHIRLEAINEINRDVLNAIPEKDSMAYIGTPKAEITYHPASICEGRFDTIQGRDPTGIANRAYWYLEDIDDISGRMNDITHFFNRPGTWTYKYATYNDVSNCISDTAEATVIVRPSPVGNFRLNRRVGCSIPHEIEITNLSTSAENFFWRLGDGTVIETNSDSTITHSYQEYGIFTITLNANSNFGCQTYSTSSTIRNLPLYIDTLNITPAQSCLSQSVHIRAIGNFGTHVNTQFIFDYGDGNIDTLIRPHNNHTYRAPGVYPVTVSVFNGQGCIAGSETYEVIVEECEDVNPLNETIELCSDTEGTPPQVSSYDLTDHNSRLIGRRMAFVRWFNDENYTSIVENPESVTVTNGDSFYASVINPAGDEDANARLDFIIKESVQVHFEPTPYACHPSMFKAPFDVSPEGGVFIGDIITEEGYLIDSLTPGLHTVQYTVSNTDVCSDTVQRTVHIFPSPRIPTVISDTLRYCQNTPELPNLPVAPIPVAAMGQHVWYNYEDTLEIANAPELGRTAGTFKYYVSYRGLICESLPSKVTIIVDSIPPSPTVSPLDPLCQYSDRTLNVSGSPDNNYSWSLDTGDNILIYETAADSITFTAQDATTITGSVNALSPEGCSSDTSTFTIPLDLLPSEATVSDQKQDTLFYCVAGSNKSMTGNIPIIGTGTWNIISNTGNAIIEADNPASPIRNFDSLNDTLIAEWVISNGVCPQNSALLTILPERPFETTLSITGPEEVCQGTEINLTAESQKDPGEHPQFYFSNVNHELLYEHSHSNMLQFSPEEDVQIFAKLIPDYHCLLSDTVYSDTLNIAILNTPVAEIEVNKNTICETDEPILVTSKDNIERQFYEWFLNGEIIYRDTVPYTFDVHSPGATGWYTLMASNGQCPPSYDSTYLEVYEQIDVWFEDKEVYATYGVDDQVLLPLQFHTQTESHISEILWSPTDFLNIAENGINAYYTPQNENIALTYEATIYNGIANQGCQATASIVVNNYRPVDIRNTFTPNGDGKNDTWEVLGLEKYSLSKLQIFNQWGMVLHEQEANSKVSWNGIHNGQLVPPATYYYVLDLKGSPDDSDYIATGWIQVIY